AGVDGHGHLASGPGCGGGYAQRSAGSRERPLTPALSRELGLAGARRRTCGAWYRRLVDGLGLRKKTLKSALEGGGAFAKRTRSEKILRYRFCGSNVVV